MGGSFHLAFEHSRMVFCKPTLRYSTSTAEACHFVSHKLPAVATTELFSRQAFH